MRPLEAAMGHGGLANLAYPVRIPYSAYLLTPVWGLVSRVVPEAEAMRFLHGVEWSPRKRCHALSGH